MKAMILAAGRGERLRPLTDKTPKPLIQVGRKRLIEYLIDNLVSAGFNELVINYAHLGEQFPKVLGDGRRYGAHIRYSPEPEGGLETAGGIIHALPLLGDAPFLVVNGDIWTDFKFASLRNYALATDKLCHLVLVENPPHHPDGDFGLDAHGNLCANGHYKATFSGIGLYRPAMFAGLSKGKRPLRPLFEEAIARGRASGQLYHGEWADIGTIERLQALKMQLLGNQKLQ